MRQRRRREPHEGLDCRFVRGTAFTLVELLVTIAVVSTLAALLLPVLGKGKELGRGAACLSNLRQIGIALQIYVQENNNRLPVMRDKTANITNTVPGPDQVLSNYVGNAKVLKCPSDKEVFEQTGCSYAWNNLLNGQNADHLQLLGMPFAPVQIPIFFDKESFHVARGKNKAQNFLYADGHIRNLLVLEGSVPAKP